jgi:hypothetical protein
MLLRSNDALHHTDRRGNVNQGDEAAFSTSGGRR